VRSSLRGFQAPFRLRAGGSPTDTHTGSSRRHSPGESFAGRKPGVSSFSPSFSSLSLSLSVSLSLSRDGKCECEGRSAGI
jgi:hypothetical protein